MRLRITPTDATPRNFGRDNPEEPDMRLRVEQRGGIDAISRGYKEGLCGGREAGSSESGKEPTNPASVLTREDLVKSNMVQCARTIENDLARSKEHDSALPDWEIIAVGLLWAYCEGLGADDSKISRWKLMERAMRRDRHMKGALGSHAVL